MQAIKGSEKGIDTPQLKQDYGSRPAKPYSLRNVTLAMNFARRRAVIGIGAHQHISLLPMSYPVFLVGLMRVCRWLIVNLQTLLDNAVASGASSIGNTKRGLVGKLTLLECFHRS